LLLEAFLKVLSEKAPGHKGLEQFDAVMPAPAVKEELLSEAAMTLR
jgi:hypothetical protein